MNVAGYAHVGISSTYRDNAHQNWLFAQGRSREGAIVTNAQGGQSWHNWRLAFDVFQNIRGQEWNNPDFFNTAGWIWTEMGGEWGGNWRSFPDRPHMQFTGGLSLTDMRNGIRLPEVITMPWEYTEATEPPLPPWATDSTAWAVSNGITDGTRPNDPATRKESWTMMHRMYRLAMD